MRSPSATIWRALPLPVQASVLMVAAMAFFTSMSVFIRLAAREIHPLEVVFFRNFLAFLLLLPWLMNQGLSTLRTSIASYRQFAAGANR